MTSPTLSPDQMRRVKLKKKFLNKLIQPTRPIQLYDELSSVITQERRPTNTDRTQLVRMDAFLHECHRVATILPLVAHATWLDTKVNGYDVSKNIEGSELTTK